jgi:hypothetical protein
MSVTVINEMLGKVFVSAEKNDDGTELKFLEKNWFDSFTFYHVDDCCESVWIEDIEGELSDLEDSPLLEAEVVSNREETNSGSRTWTFSSSEQRKGMWSFAGAVVMALFRKRISENHQTN